MVVGGEYAHEKISADAEDQSRRSVFNIQLQRPCLTIIGLYGSIQACLPHWKNQSWQARIIAVSPPIYSRFFRGKTTYAMSTQCRKSAQILLIPSHRKGWHERSDEGNGNGLYSRRKEGYGNHQYLASFGEFLATTRLKEADPS